MTGSLLHVAAAKRVRMCDFMQYRSNLRALPVTLQRHWKINVSFQTRRHEYHCRNALCANASAALSIMRIVAGKTTAKDLIANRSVTTLAKMKRSDVCGANVEATALKTTSNSAVTK